MTVTRHRYPFAPVEMLVRYRQGVDTSDLQIGRYLGVHHTNLPRWRARGVTLLAAERCAHQLGVHPYELWPGMPDDILASSGVA
jgi:hypothetical protein